MSQDSFIFNFNVKEFETAQEFPKSNVVELEGSKWYLGIEKKGISDRTTLCYWKILDICLSCERGTPSGIYLVNLALILKGSLIDVLFTRTYYFKPLDLDMHCFKIEYNYLLDSDNGFIDENGEGKIMAEISVKRVDDKEIFEHDGDQLLQEIGLCPQELNGIINLQGGHRMLVNKELLSRHSKYFDTIFNNENFVESSQESIDLTDFTYNQFRLLHKHIYETPAQFTDGSLEYRLHSKDGVKEFQRIWTLDDVRKYFQLRTNLPIQDNSSKTYSKENLAVFDDLKQMAAYTGFIFCLFTDYLRREDRTVSEENIEDLLSVGSYFQISKIVDSCKEFLSRNTFYPDYSVQRRLELAEKYNLTSVTALAMNLDNAQICNMDEKTPDIFVNDQVLVQFTFLDTGDEEMCSVKFIDGMTIHKLFFNALLDLYFKQICFKQIPLDYEIENMRISDLETSSEVEFQRKDIYNNPMSNKAQFDRIYSFKVRRIQNQSIGTDDLSPSTSSGTVQQLLTVQPAFQFSISNEVEINHLIHSTASEDKPTACTLGPSSFESDSCSRLKACKPLSGKSIWVRVTFLDSGNERHCAVPHHLGMRVENLLSAALLTLYYRDKEDMIYQPSNYKLEAARFSISISKLEDVPLDVQYAMSGYVLTTHMYSFDVRLKTAQDSPESSCQDRQKLIESVPQSLEESLRTSKQSTNVPTLEMDDAENILPKKNLPDILVHITFLDTGSFLDTKICTVPYHNAMSIQGLFSDALSNLYFNDPFCNPLPWDYKAERVRISIPDSTSGDESEDTFLDFQAIMFRYVIPSQIYTFEVRQKTEKESLGLKEMVTNSKMRPTEIPNADRMPTDILVLLNFLDINDQKFCNIPYKTGMSVQNLLFMALKDSRSPFEYNIENVYVSDSNSTSDSELHSLHLQDIETISVNSSYAYNFLMRRKTDEPSTSKKKQ